MRISVWLDAFDRGAAVIVVFHRGGLGAFSGISLAGNRYADFHAAHRDSWADELAEAVRLRFYLGAADCSALALGDDWRELSWRAAGRGGAGISDGDQDRIGGHRDRRGIFFTGARGPCAGSDL